MKINNVMIVLFHASLATDVGFDLIESYASVINLLFTTFNFLVF